VLYFCTKHPKAKSLAPDGTSGTFETRRLSQRSSVVAASGRYVGKETDWRWEQGKDLSLVAWKTVEYKARNRWWRTTKSRKEFSRPEFANQNTKQKVSHHTINRILQGENVRRKTAQIVKQRQASLIG
jgi:hypothetical protein